MTYMKWTDGKIYKAESARLAIRPMTLDDCALIVGWRNDEDTRRRYVYREEFTLESEKKYFLEKVAPENAERIHFMIVVRETGTAIGCLVYQNYDSEKREIEAGIFIGDKSGHGKGYGPEAFRLGTEWCFDNLEVDRVFSRIFTDNIPSIQCLLKVGYTITGLIKDVECTDGEKKDMDVLSIRRKDINKGTDHKAESSKLVSFVIPCYHSEATLPGVVKEIDDTMRTLDGYTSEIVMVNDGYGGPAWDMIRELCSASDPSKRRGVCLAKNFGQHAALMAGIREAKGDYVICLDDDGQTPADEAGKLLAAIDNGADVVYAKYDHKQHSGFRNFGTALNEEMTHSMLGKPRDLYVSSYFCMRRYIADEVLRYENSYPYLIGLVLRATTNIVNVEVNHRKREIGESGYTFTKLLALWMNGFTAFSIKPLRIATFLGSISAVAGFIYGIYTVIKKIVNPGVPMGFSALMSAVVFFGGMTILMVGMAGEYIGRTYITVNKAPQYVIRETTFTDDDK